MSDGSDFRLESRRLECQIETDLVRFGIGRVVNFLAQVESPVPPLVLTWIDGCRPTCSPTARCTRSLSEDISLESFTVVTVKREFGFTSGFEFESGFEFGFGSVLEFELEVGPHPFAVDRTYSSLSVNSNCSFSVTALRTTLVFDSLMSGSVSNVLICSFIPSVSSNFPTAITS